MTILPYTKDRRPWLEEPMVAYMTELDTGIPESIIRTRIFDLIHSLLDREIIHIDLLHAEGTLAGFSVYQIDTPESDWCKRPGWGFIREFFISQEFRRHGAGQALAAHTEAQLRSLGAEGLYLTSTGAVPFWQRCGWQLTAERCSNGQFILEKE